MKKLLLFACLMTLLASCSEDRGWDTPSLIDNKHTDIPVTDKEIEMIENNCDFSFSLLKAIDDNSENKDCIAISPLSFSLSLSMLANGAKGETCSEILAGIGYDGCSMSDINSLNTKLLDSLPVIDKAVNVNLANSIWFNDGIEPKDDFSNTLASCYYADVFSRDFANASTLGEINQWCTRMTNGKVNSLLNYLDRRNMMLLVNSIYFEAPWNVKFGETLRGKFTTLDNTLQDVEFFKGKQFARYYLHNKFEAIQLDYGNKAFTYTLVLPLENVSVDECLDELASGACDKLVNSYVGYSSVVLTMPKYEVEFKISANVALRSLGIDKPFVEGADFSGIYDGSFLKVGDVVHACSFKVDKDGTEAAAATAIGLVNGVPPTLEREIVVDRPFLFFVQEQSSGAMLFVGKVGAV